MRVKAALTATSIAEAHRDAGRHCVLMMDSVTRFARALREVGLAAGEPPTRQGYPPSVFATLPRLFERAGCGETGAITGIYTVLVAGDDVEEPVSDETISLLDGHILMSRELAARQQRPAIDVVGSVSRVMGQLELTDEHRRVCRQGARGGGVFTNRSARKCRPTRSGRPTITKISCSKQAPRYGRRSGSPWAVRRVSKTRSTRCATRWASSHKSRVTSNE